MGKSDGVSLISLIVTIICIIIIATISVFSGFGTPEMAAFSKFTEEINNVKVAITNKRAENFAEYDNADYGFTKVIVKNAPASFSTFDSSEVTGYLVNFDKIDYSLIDYGNGVITDGEVEFEKDDVFVYDSKGIVYYVLGYEYEDKIYYNAKTYIEN